MVAKVAAPAADSNSAPVSPENAAEERSISIQSSLKGYKIDVEGLPEAPTTDMYSAPLFAMLWASEPLVPVVLRLEWSVGCHTDVPGLLLGQFVQIYSDFS